MDDIRFWLALTRVPGLGPVQCQALLDCYDHPRRIFAEAPDDSEARGFLSRPAFDGLCSPDWDAVAADLAWLSSAGHDVVTRDDPRYPPLLTQIHQPPPLLYVDGDAELLATPQIAIVGSRNPSAGGCDTAFEFARSLAQHGFTVTSGLAIGIDAAAHRGALAAGGRTIAVAATGLDRVYPARHRALAAEIRETAALVSEFAPGSPPLPGSFPRRNRIISGLSGGTLVVEANPRSGSLITARAAVEQGREVFAIPGSIHNPCARGCHRLIRDGAKLVESIEDILEELEPMACAGLQKGVSVGTAPGTHTPPQGTAAGILNLIDFAPTTIDTLIERSGFPAENLYPLLLDLELSDLIIQAPGGSFMRRKGPET